MALKKATFPFPARYALRTFLNRPHVGLSMDNIMNGQEFYDKLNLIYIGNWTRGNTDKKGAVQYSKLFEATEETKAVTVDVDEVYLTWLQNALKAHDWSAVRSPDGRQVAAGVPAELQACIGSLWRAVNEALSS